MVLKKSLFSKPSWAAKSAAPVEDDRPIFQQNVYGDILEAKRKKEEKKLARQKEKDEQGRKSASLDTKIDEDKKPLKKLRLSNDLIDLDLDQDEDEDEDEDHDLDTDSARSSSASERDGPLKRVGRGSRKPSTTVSQENTPQFRSTSRKKSSPSSSNEQVESNRRARSVTIEAQDSDIVIMHAQSTPAPPKPQSKMTAKLPLPPEEHSDSDSDSDPDEDEYLKELKRVARAQARSKRQPDSEPPPLSPLEPRLPIDSLDDKERQALPTDTTPATLSTDPSDPEVEIWIHSIIPNCTECIIRRKASQNLETVLTYFIERNGINDRLAEKIFLSWNGSKLFKSTTMRAILQWIKNKHGTKQDGSDISDGKIKIEAVTEEIFLHRLNQKEREKQRIEDDYKPSSDDLRQAGIEGQNGLITSEDQAPKRKPGGIVIQLKSDDDTVLPSMNLRVYPHTTIQRIIKGYKNTVGVDQEREVYLVFDGDRLELQDTAGVVGFDNGDVVDVKAK